MKKTLKHIAFMLTFIFAMIFDVGNLYAASSTAKLTIESFSIQAGSEAKMVINMENLDAEITCVQFDLRLPQGLTIKKSGSDFDIDIEDRTNWRNHSLDANVLSDVTRFLLSSTKNSVITGTSGAIISINLVAASTFKEGEIKIENTLLVTPDQKESFPADYSYTVKAKDETVKVTGITLNVTSATMSVGDTKQLSASISPSNATDKSVTWTSSSASVASVSSTGLVTAKAEGTATITCKANDGSGKSATCSITVKSSVVKVSSISLNVTSATLNIGDTKQLSATVSPSNATDKSVTWTSSSASVASVSSTGLVTAKVEGSTTITCKANDGSGVMAKCEINVKKVTEENVASGVDGNITWSLSKDGVLTLSGKGKMNDYDWSTPWDPYHKQINSVVIKEGITNVSGCAFVFCSYLTSVTIPNSVTSIGEFAFGYCSSLKSITIPNSVTSIGESAFNSCSSLKSITIPNSVTSIGEHAFAWCDALTSFVVDKDNKYYSSENDVLYDKNKTKLIYCAGSKKGSISVPNTVASIEEYAFCNCNELTSVTISYSVTSIGKDAFVSCDGLTSFVVDKENKYYSSENDVLYNKDKAELIYCAEGKKGSISIPNTVINIGEEAFSGCGDLTSVTIPNSVKSIGKESFSWCNLTTVIIPNSVTSIGYDAFYYCNRLTSVIIPNSVTSIGSYAFYNCSSLKTVTSYITTPFVLESVFKDINMEATLYVPQGTKSLYQKTEGWKDFKYIQEMEVSNVSVDVSHAGYATFYSSESAYTLPNGLSAQVVTGCTNNKLTYKSIADGSVSGVIPKGTAVMLVSDSKSAGTFTLTPSESTSSYSGTNYLHGSDEPTTTSTSGNNYYYKLTYGDNGTEYSNIFGWYWGAQNGDAFQIEGHKAWLALPKSAVTRSAFGIDATDIDGVNVESGEDMYYDLQGRRISTPTTSGIYIVNGKKVFIKKK